MQIERLQQLLKKLLLVINKLALLKYRELFRIRIKIKIRSTTRMLPL